MQIYVTKNGQQIGPFTEEEVYDQLESGNAKGTDLAWCEGRSDWVPLSEILSIAPEPVRPQQPGVHLDSPSTSASEQAAGNATSTQGGVTGSRSIDSRNPVERKHFVVQGSPARSIPQPPPLPNSALQSSPNTVKRNIGKLILFGILWSVAFYVVGSILASLVIIAAGGKSAEETSSAVKAVFALLLFLTLVSPILAICLTVKGKLPGTKRR